MKYTHEPLISEDAAQTLIKRYNLKQVQARLETVTSFPAYFQYEGWVTLTQNHILEGRNRWQIMRGYGQIVWLVVRHATCYEYTAEIMDKIYYPTDRAHTYCYKSLTDGSVL